MAGKRNLLVLTLAVLAGLLAPVTGPGQETEPKALSSADIYDLLQKVRQGTDEARAEALGTLMNVGSGEAFRGLENIIADSSELPRVRRSTALALGKSKSDQAGLYLVDAHKELREEFSQTDATLKVAKAYAAFAQAAEKWSVSQGPCAELKGFGVVLKGILSGKDSDLSVVTLALLRFHPYQQILDYLGGVCAKGGTLERVVGACSLAGLSEGVGLPALRKVFDESDVPEAARLAAYVLVLKGYDGVPGASAFALKRLRKEKVGPLQLVLVKGIGKRAGREGLEVLKAIRPVRPWSVKAIEVAKAQIVKRHPSEVGYFFTILSIAVIVCLFILAVGYLRMPPTVIERFYLRDTAFCDVTVKLAECDMTQVVQSVVRIDPTCFVRFIRVSLIYEGRGEIAFRQQSFALLEDSPANFVGGGTIVDGWYWNRGQARRVVANWYFDLKKYAELEGKPPLMIGLLYRSSNDEETPQDRVIHLKIAGCKPQHVGATAAYQDQTYHQQQSGT